MVDVGNFICNRIYNPSVILYSGQDYTIRNRIITFEENIFNNSLVASRDIYNDSGQAVDKEISLWAPRAFIDKNDLYKRYGSMLGVAGESSEEYKSLLKTLLALFMNGPKNRFIEGFLNAVFDLPIVLEPEETIKFVIEEQNKTLIYTDKHVYDLEHKDKVRFFEPGTVVKQFQPFYDIIQIISMKDVPTFFQNRKFIIIPERLLGHQYGSSVLIKKEQRINVEAKVGATFKITLDGEISPEFQKELDSFPVTVGMPGLTVKDGTFRLDVFDYVVDQIKDNLFVILVDPTKVKVSKFTDELIKAFDLSVPAFCAYLILMETHIDGDIYETANVSDEINTYPGFTLNEELVSGTHYDAGYFGLPRVGMGLRVGSIASPTFNVGVPTFMPKPYVQVIDKGCGS